MASRKVGTLIVFLLVLVCVGTLPASAQSFRVQCPTSTITHPVAANNNSEPAFVGPTYTGTSGYPTAPAHVNGAIKCQQISGGDGFSTMGDGTQTYMFSFGPLSGLADIANGLPGTEFPGADSHGVVGNGFNAVYSGAFLPGDPATNVSAGSGPNPAPIPGFTYNGAVGLTPDLDSIAAGRCTAPCLNGHVDARPIIDVGVMNGNIPAPLLAIDEDDEFFLTLTNVGMIMRPDLFEQHTVHFHGYPNASSFYDGVPDASVAINIGGSFTYYYLAPDAGTYFWHCHITPPEHLQMGMVGQLYVRPRQNRVVSGGDLYTSLQQQELDNRTKCDSTSDILCSNPIPAIGIAAHATRAATGNYAYNDGDGSTHYDVEYPIQIHGFDPNFHFVGMTFNPEEFADMKDKYFLLNGRSYPDTVSPGPLATQASDGKMHFSQPLSSIINIPVGGKALLRISDLDVQEHQTLASIGIPMTVIGYNAKLLRDQAGNNLYYNTNSITLGGGESLDAVLDASDTTKYSAGQVFYLYTPNLDHLSNDAENFGGLMTEVHICNSVSGSTFGSTCN
ncbi:MAG: multicopper oxidase domain-containing protein [Candidatus Acidiferrum sp.]